eukprot:c9865_g1_i2.p1 GENE.c9865_g1_i2~~c9865_g1_i2.p1  ORF type:complete len:295 (+),score=41.16 c9865_g1_i2:41-925(+)
MVKRRLVIETQAGAHGDSKVIAISRNKSVRRRLGEPVREAIPDIIGTSTALERTYLRLTSAPDPSLIRPAPILWKALELLQTKWNTTHNYDNACEQMKSIRQDLTVQRIRNDLTIAVYECHARIALEVGDLSEFNQCQTQLHELYDELPSQGSVAEFTAYKVLYLLVQSDHSGLGAVISHLPLEMRKQNAVKHAVQVCNSFLQHDFVRFFRLYRLSPHMSARLIDHVVEGVRDKTLRALCTAYFPDVPISYVAEVLGFEQNVRLCTKFLLSRGAVCTRSGMLDTKTTRTKFANS